MKLIDELVAPGTRREALQNLWYDEQCRPAIIKEIGKLVKQSPAIVIQNPLAQLMGVLATADFQHDQEEPVLVAGMVMEYKRHKEILPSVEVHRGRDLAARCLISLGFFYDALKRRYELHAAPKPSYYREVGTVIFQHLGQRNLADNFHRWERRLGEFLPH